MFLRIPFRILRIQHACQTQPLGRRGNTRIPAAAADETSPDLFDRDLPGSRLHDRSCQDTNHIVQEPVPLKSKRKERTFAFDKDIVYPSNGRLNAASARFISIEIMRAGQNIRRLAHQLHIGIAVKAPGVFRIKRRGLLAEPYLIGVDLAQGRVSRMKIRRSGGAAVEDITMSEDGKRADFVFSGLKPSTSYDVKISGVKTRGGETEFDYDWSFSTVNSVSFTDAYFEWEKLVKV